MIKLFRNFCQIIGPRFNGSHAQDEKTLKPKNQTVGRNAQWIGVAAKARP